MPTMMIGRTGRLLNPVEFHYKLVTTEAKMQDSLNELFEMCEVLDNSWLKAAAENLREAIVDIDVIKETVIDYVVDDPTTVAEKHELAEIEPRRIV